MPVRVACSACGKEYSLKDEFAGRKVKCQACETVIIVPEAVSGVSKWDDASSNLHEAFRRDKFLLRQKAFTIGEKYEVWNEEGQTILYVERPTFLVKALLAVFLFLMVFMTFFGGMIALSLTLFEKNDLAIGVSLALGGILGLALATLLAVRVYPKRHILFYEDKTKDHQMLEVLQDQKVTFLTATFTCLSEEGEPLGVYRKNYLYDIFRKKWEILSPAGELIAVAREDSVLLSMLRRLIGPLFGILRTNFVILSPDEEEHLGDFNRKFTLLDRYVLDMTPDVDQRLDRRLAVALGVLLDTGERR